MEADPTEELLALIRGGTMQWKIDGEALEIFIWPTRACRNVMKKGRCAETSFTDKPMPGTSQISARAHGALRASAMQTWREVVAAA